MHQELSASRIAGWEHKPAQIPRRKPACWKRFLGECRAGGSVGDSRHQGTRSGSTSGGGLKPRSRGGSAAAPPADHRLRIRPSAGRKIPVPVNPNHGSGRPRPTVDELPQSSISRGVVGGRRPVDTSAWQDATTTMEGAPGGECAVHFNAWRTGNACGHPAGRISCAPFPGHRASRAPPRATPGADSGPP